jgi:hypothetical protein
VGQQKAFLLLKQFPKEAAYLVVEELIRTIQ